MPTGITVGEVMIRGVVTARKTDSIETIAKIMNMVDIGSVIITERGIVKGIVTEGDIIKDVVAKNKSPKGMQVNKIMKHPVRTVEPEADLEEASKILRDLNISVLPVVNKKGMLVGIISERDMIKMQPGLLEIMQKKETLERTPAEQRLLLSGECESCGNFSESLRWVKERGKFLCEDCW